ncbi:unnamed protein product [Nezara viridula]|uniref:Cytochrome P450 n=1 Tax=Nezara viridula TaxID=85310 RepID=A0A9P0ED77_NEZVI|nr:unnamed protein product [Nezara viridula]
MEKFATTAFIIAVAHLVLGLLLWFRVRKLYSYPGLLGFPVFGNLYYFYRTLFLVTMDSMEKYMIRISETYGKDGLCFHWIYGFRTLVTVTNPHIVKEIGFHPNVTHKPNFIFSAFHSYFSGPFVSSRSDDLWKIQRKEYDTFLKKSRVESEHSNTFSKYADQMIELMLASPSADILRAVTLEFTHNSTMETLFGVDSSIVYNPQVIGFMSVIPVLGTLSVANPKLAGTIFGIFKKMESFFLRTIEKTRRLILEDIYSKILTSSPVAANKKALLSRQITSRMRKCNEDEDKLINELMELFVTSSGTTHALLSSSLIFLALLPDIQERAWQEQYEIFDNDKRDATFDDLSQMRFLDRFIKEALRFVAPPFYFKSVTGDTTIRMHYTTTLMKVALSKIIRRLKLRPVQKDFRFEDIQFETFIMRELANPPVLQVEQRE